MKRRRLQYLNNEYGEEHLIDLYDEDLDDINIVSKEKFISNLDLKIDLPDNLFVAGGRILTSLLDIKEDNDFDIFGFDITEEYLKDYIYNLCKEHSVEHINLYGWSAYTINVFNQAYQFIFRNHKTREECILMFDMPCCSFLYHNNTVYTTEFGLEALRTRRISAVRTKRLHRVIKYMKRGFDISLIGPLENPPGEFTLYKNTAPDNILLEDFLKRQAIMETEYRLNLLKYENSIDQCYICSKYMISENDITFCQDCKDFNDTMRDSILSQDLSGRVFMITGIRVKLGKTLTKHIVNNNGYVIGTTRYPKLAEKEYTEDELTRIKIFRCDFISIQDILDLVTNIKEFLGYDFYYSKGKIFCLINNAAQTIYESVADRKRLIVTDGEAKLPGEVELYDRMLDNRSISSWNATIEKIMDIEIAETALINSIAPLLLIKKLKEVITDQIINISSSESDRRYKSSSRHVHTNCTKAYLDMITYSCGESFVRTGIKIVSVDPGWLSSYSDNLLKKPQLNFLDGVARVLHPIFTKAYGCKIKNYKILNENFLEPNYNPFEYDFDVETNPFIRRTELKKYDFISETKDDFSF